MLNDSPSPETRPDPESESHSPASDGTTFPNDNSSRSAHSAAEESAARTIVALSYRSYADTMLEGALRVSTLPPHVVLSHPKNDC